MLAFGRTLIYVVEIEIEIEIEIMSKHCCLPYHFFASKLIFLPFHTEQL